MEGEEKIKPSIKMTSEVSEVSKDDRSVNGRSEEHMRKRRAAAFFREVDPLEISAPDIPSIPMKVYPMVTSRARRLVIRFESALPNEIFNTSPALLNEILNLPPVIQEEFLLSAVEDGDHSQVQSLLDAGISPEITDRQGKGLLDIAVKRSDLPMCTLLLEHVAIPKAMKQSLLTAVGKGNHYRASCVVAVIDGIHCKALLLTVDDADPTYSKGGIQRGISNTGSDHAEGVQHKYSTGTQMNQLTQERKMVQEMIAALLFRMMMALEMLGTVILSMNIMESQKVWSVIQDEYIGEFNMFDYGATENFQRYGQKRPPTYDVLTIKNPSLLILLKERLDDGRMGYRTIRTEARKSPNLSRDRSHLFHSLRFPLGN